MRTEASLRAAAARAGLRIDSIEAVPVAGGGTELAARMSFDDPWAAARLLFDLSDEDASDPIVRAWSLAILKATAAEIGESAGPTISPRLRDAFARAIHANVQAHVKFVHEPEETFQASRVTMATGAGDCDDHARLVYALATAGHIPAQLVFFEEPDGSALPTILFPGATQPVHVVAMLEDSGGTWQWAETTIEADYGEEPHEALARLGDELGPDSNPFAQSMGAPSGWANLATPLDVMAYRRMWNPYVVGTANAALACARSLEAQAKASGDPSGLLALAADTERTNAEALMVRWNLHANTPDYQIVINAADILQDQQDAVLHAGQIYRDAIAKDCPHEALPSAPTSSVQSGVIGAIEGAGILAHGVLQILGAGVDGALETLGPIVNPSAAALDTVKTLAIAAAVAAGAYAVSQALELVPRGRR